MLEGFFCCFDKYQLISTLLFYLQRNDFPSLKICYQIITISVNQNTIYPFLTKLMNWLVMAYVKEKLIYQTSLNPFQTTN